MMGSKLSRYMMRSLKRGKRAKLGLFEMALLLAAGRRDGKSGLPKENEEGRWTSAKIQKELNACNESHRKIYGTMQIRLEKKYRRANQLVDRLSVCERRLKELKEQEPQEPTDEELRVRRHGEENLSDSQVRGRRQREYNRAREKYSDLAAEVRKRAEKELEELIEVRSYLIQISCEAELVCGRIMSHTQQRIDFYWNAARRVNAKTHPEMPVTYGGLPIPNVTEEYQRTHEREQECMENIISRFKLSEEAV